jgi:hypothetical protein
MPEQSFVDALAAWQVVASAPDSFSDVPGFSSREHRGTEADAEAFFAGTIPKPPSP